MIRTPTYFLSIGGPNFIEQTSHPAYGKLGAIGHEITTRIKPKAVIVFSAHWQARPDSLQINAAEQTDIIYDFSGFPPHFYEFKYPNTGSPKLAQEIVDTLSAAGVRVDKVERGLDHGVWAGFMAAFEPKSNPLGVPIVQVSLFDNEGYEQHYRVGQALGKFREQGIVIVGAGMAVHNLFDFRKSIGKTVAPEPYSKAFEDDMRKAIAADPSERLARMTEVMRRSDARNAHPSVEHILPVFIAAGAAGSDVGEALWTYPEKSLNWAQYRFGQVQSSDAEGAKGEL